jgi:transposase
LSKNTPIIYLDESGIEQHMQREYAWSKRGKKVTIFRPGRKFKRTNIIAAQFKNQIIAPFQYSWSTNSAWFGVWFEWYLCPNLPQKSVIIMDNASFHRKTQLCKIAAFYGFEIIWLPPYSPDKNPIEHLWANLKKWLRKFSKNFKTIQEAICNFFI